MFHRACYQALPREERCCPHCGSRRAPLPVQLKITMAKTPLRFLQVHYHTVCPVHCTDCCVQYTSKMTMSKPEAPAEVWQADRRRESEVHYKLPSGKVISADGMPRGLEPAKLEELLQQFESKTNAKVTTRNMFVPTQVTSQDI